MSNSSQIAAPLVVQNSGQWLGNDGNWSTFEVVAGTPAQTFQVLPSFDGQTVYLPVDKDCERLQVNNCGASRGVEVFQSKQGSGFQTNASSSWNLTGTYSLGLGAQYNFSGNTLYGYDTAGVRKAGTTSDITLTNLAISAFATPNLWLGRLGLSSMPIMIDKTQQPHSLLSRLKEAKNIPSLSFGYQAGSPYRFNKVPGSLVLGGYDRSRIGNTTLQIPLTGDVFVGLQQMTARLNNGTTVTVLNQGIKALIDTSVSEMWMPQSVCDSIASLFGLTYYEPSSRYLVSDSAHSSLTSLNPTFSLQIGGPQSGGLAINIDLPYAAFDVAIGYPVFGNATRYFPIRRAVNESQYALGRVFLQEVYLTVDWEHNIANISQAAFANPAAPQDIVTIQPKDDQIVQTAKPKAHKKLSGGAIGGIVVGVLLLFLLIAAFFVMRRRRAAKRKAPHHEYYGPTEKEVYAADHHDGIYKPPVEIEEMERAELEGTMVDELEGSDIKKHHHDVHEMPSPPLEDSKSKQLGYPAAQESKDATKDINA